MPNKNGNIRSMQDLFRAIGRMEGTMETFCKTLKSHDKLFHYQDKRINRIETDVDTAKGKSVAYGTLAAFITTIGIFLAKVFLFKDK